MNYVSSGEGEQLGETTEVAEDEATGKYGVPYHPRKSNFKGDIGKGEAIAYAKQRRTELASWDKIAAELVEMGFTTVRGTLSGPTICKLVFPSFAKKEREWAAAAMRARKAGEPMPAKPRVRRPPRVIKNRHGHASIHDGVVFGKIVRAKPEAKPVPKKPKSTFNPATDSQPKPKKVERVIVQDHGGSGLPTAAPGQLVLIMGTPEQIREVLR